MTPGDDVRPDWVDEEISQGRAAFVVPLQRIAPAGLSRNAGTALPVGDPAGGSLDLKSETSLLGLVNTVVK